MPTLEISEDQAERLREAQITIQGRLVGKYGRVSPQDAIEYLLDQYDENEDDEEELSDDERDEAAERIVELAEVTTQTTDGGRLAVQSESGSEAGTEDSVATDDAGSAEADDEATEADDSSGTGNASESAAAMLSNTMNLLNEHADRWGEDETGEDRYAVELPDGTTERARTKDDVRALLFKHY